MNINKYLFSDLFVLYESSTISHHVNLSSFFNKQNSISPQIHLNLNSEYRRSDCGKRFLNRYISLDRLPQALQLSI